MALAAEAAEESLRAAMMAAPLFCTVSMNSPSKNIVCSARTRGLERRSCERKQGGTDLPVQSLSSCVRAWVRLEHRDAADRRVADVGELRRGVVSPDDASVLRTATARARSHAPQASSAWAPLRRRAHPLPYACEGGAASACACPRRPPRRAATWGVRNGGIDAGAATALRRHPLRASSDRFLPHNTRCRPQARRACSASQQAAGRAPYNCIKRNPRLGGHHRHAAIVIQPCER